MALRDTSHSAHTHGRSRGMVLRSIRSALANSRRGGDSECHAYQDTITREAHGTATATMVDRFVKTVIAVGANCIRVATRQEAAQVLLDQLHYYRATLSTEQHFTPLRLGISDASIVGDVLSSAKEGLERACCAIYPVGTLTRDSMFTLDIGITGAQWDIAETGTLVLETVQERNRLLSLVPAIHIAILSATHLCETMADVLTILSNPETPDDLLGSGAVTFITGPSRTSDIELTLVVGVHGPQQLVVIVIDETPEAMLP
jgi:L-lactate dehydrogenase complex protein LldG